MTNDPTIAVLGQSDPSIDSFYIQENLTNAAKAIEHQLPIIYRDALVEPPEVRDWIVTLVESAKESQTPRPIVTTGPSLLLLGPIGAGKTHQACAAVRALSVSGAHCGWEMLTAADLYARLRPRPRIDSEDEFNTIANTTLLILDDFGAAKATEWTEEVNHRLINYRYQWRKPTLLTSNVPPQELGVTVGQRVASRLLEMTTTVILEGGDRRRNLRPAT